MTDKLRNWVRAEVLRAIENGRATLRAGNIDSYDPDSYSAKVTIQPEGVITGWLQIAAEGYGGGFGFFVGPLQGDQVLVAHLEGDRESGLIIRRLNSDDNPPPSVPGGEMWALHQSGSYLKFTNDGKVSVHGTVVIAIGNLGNTLRKFVIDTFMALFNMHTHPTPSGESDAPTQQMDDTHLTTITKGN